MAFATAMATAPLLEDPQPVPSAPPEDDQEFGCIVCGYVSGSEVCQFSCGCDLVIHEKCISAWQQVGGTCPFCQQMWIVVPPIKRRVTASAPASVSAQPPRPAEEGCKNACLYALIGTVLTGICTAFYLLLTIPKGGQQ